MKNRSTYECEMPAGGALNDEQIAYCRHPAGRMIYNFSVFFVILLLILSTVLLIKELGLHKELSNSIISAQIQDIERNANAHNVSSSVDEGLPRISLHGNWLFNEVAPWESLNITASDIQMQGIRGDDLFVNANYQSGYLMVERISKRAGRPTVEKLVLPVKLKNGILVISYQGKEYLANRDLKRSEETLIGDAFGDDLSFIGSSLLTGFPAVYVMGFIVLGLGFVVWLKVGLYSKTQVEGIKLSHEQFPKAYSLYEKLARQMGFQEIPEIYLVNGNGVYNAFASCVTGFRKYTCVHAEIFQAFESGGDEKAFMMVLGHELGHIRLGHTSLFKNIIGILLNFIPIFGKIITRSYGRAFEYEADRMSMHFVKGPEAAQRYLMLHSSNSLYKHINLHEYRIGSSKNLKFGMIINNLLSSHPIAPWRVDAFCRCSIAGIFVHTLVPESNSIPTRARMLFQSYRD